MLRSLALTRTLARVATSPVAMSSARAVAARMVRSARLSSSAAAGSDATGAQIVQPLTVLTDSEKELQEAALRFAREQIAPLVGKMEAEQKFDKGLLKSLFENGFMGVDVAEEFGGGGMTFFQSILVVEALSRVDPSVAVMVDIQNTLINNIVNRFASKELKARLLPRLATDTLASFGLSEAGAGSDAFALTTSARVDGDHYVLNGNKLWISNAADAGLFFVFATVDKSAGYRGITCFVVERDAPGFRVGKKEDKLGIRASSTCELILEDVRVHKSNILGEVGKGYKIAIEALNEGRIGIGAWALGLAQGAFDDTVPYLIQRKQFGQSLTNFQGVQFQIARARAEIEAARLLVYNAARLQVAGLPFLREASIAKLVATETAKRVSAEMLDLCGGVGFTKDFPQEKRVRDAAIGTIYEGSTNMQLQTIAKTVIKEYE